MPSESALRAIQRVANDTGVSLNVTESTLTVDGVQVPLPSKLTGERDELMGMAPLFPNTARGDDRDKILWGVIADAAPSIEQTALRPDSDLNRSLAGRLGLPTAAAEVTADALRDRYFNRKQVQMMLPAHGSLPLNYAHTTGTGKPARYRMWNGGVLPFLLWNAEQAGIDGDLLADVIGFVTESSELTVLDRLFLRVALEGGPRPDTLPSAEHLTERYQDAFTKRFAPFGGPFCQPSLDQFREDLRAVLTAELPRPDKISWLTLLLSLHLSIRLYRLAVVKGFELDLVVAAAGQIAPPAEVRGCACVSGQGPEALEDCPLAGKIKFRAGTGAYRPVSLRDGCRSSYADVDQRRLLDLPATLVTSTLASAAWAALGGGEAAEKQDLKALASALASNSELRDKHSAVCAAVAIMHHDAFKNGQAPESELVAVGQTAANRPGVHALREDVRKLRRTDLRHQSRDVVNQLLQVKAVNGPGTLISRNGNLPYFEIDEQLLLLLTRLVSRGEPTPIDDFLRGLRRYGLEPQDADEAAAVADALERLGLLARYSDSGEASFVRF
ncbi:hypothetical protein [Microbacterium sp. JZ31]|uniref:hypothetical protein n=1 Tax=Microbacterium sp. JZ31 TaxID=1906274 RepID=UPI001934971A|nr:hypothetical protein [Microbacterium sp. JZ31]